MKKIATLEVQVLLANEGLLYRFEWPYNIIKWAIIDQETNLITWLDEEQSVDVEHQYAMHRKRTELDVAEFWRQKAGAISKNPK